MTETEWLRARSVNGLLLRLPGHVSDRKLLLFACACCRRLEERMEDHASREAIDTLERFADRKTSFEATIVASELAAQAAGVHPRFPPVSTPAYVAYELTRLPLYRHDRWRFCKQVGFVAACATHASAEVVLERRVQKSLARDIFRSCIKPLVIDDTWLQGNDGCVVRLAETIYTERHFTDLPILGDALLDAGCDDEDLLDHCRSSAPHVRGCWVVDALLGKD
jgi:hypothetical protein